MVRDTAESLLSAAHLTSSEDREIVEALEESEAQFARGEGIPVAEAWRRLGIGKASPSKFLQGRFVTLSVQNARSLMLPKASR